MVLLIPRGVEVGGGVDEKKEYFPVIVLKVFDQVVLAVEVKHVESV